MAEVNDCLSAINDLFLLVEERNYPEDGLADDDSWVDNISQDGNDINEFESVSESNFPTSREEELQEYNDCNALDFTLHTIVEESCEDSELEHENGVIKSNEPNDCEITHISPSELERYFFFGLGDGDKSTVLEDSSSEIFSDCSENGDTIEKNDIYPSDTKYALDLSTSRLEKYFLSGFMGFSNENKSDGSVGSDSEGQPSPSHRKKKFVRARGTPRSINSSLDNLLLESSDLLSDQLTESLHSSESETDSLPEMGITCDKLDSIESVKRKKNYRKRDPFEQKSNMECKTPNFLETPVGIKNQDSCINEDLYSHQNLNVQINRFTNIPPHSTKKALVRKDSFNNWSSDEETNLMMSKMRQFFKTLIVVTTQNYTQSNNFGTYSGQIFQERRCKVKPFQFSYFENELIRLMKSVPGINNQQVREIVEYFSSEDTWSDSNDSSDCNVSNVEVDLKKSKNEKCFDYLKNGTISTSIVGNGTANEPMSTESVWVYTNLIESFIANNSKPSPEVNTDKNYNSRCSDKSPHLVANVMQHIGRKLVALMHDVSIGADSIVEPEIDIQQKNNTQSEENSTKIVLDHSDYSRHAWGHLPRSKSHDILLGSSNRNALIDNPGEVSDCDRFSWRGSFESALLAPGDSRNKLLTVDRDNCSLSSEVSISKRGSADNLTYSIIQNREQLDRVQSCGSIGIVDKENRSDVQKTRIMSLCDIKNKTELQSPSRIKVESVINTNSLPRLQSIQFSDVSNKLLTDSNATQSNVKSARYRSPSNTQTNIFSSLSKTNALQSSGLNPSDISQRRITSSTSLDDFSISEFSCNNKSPGLQRNHLYKRSNANFVNRSDSLTSVYSDAFDNRYDSIRVKGQIEFAMQYNYKVSAFEIHIVKCKDLAAADTKRCKSDPYVKVYLLPDKSKNGKRKTKVKKNTLNPIFDEIMRFNVSVANLETRSVWVTVWHSDMFCRNDFLGEVTINLQGKVFDNPQSQWYFLQEKNEDIDEHVRYRGDMVVGLKFVSLDPQVPTSDSSFCKLGNIKSHNKGELHVLIKEAKNLHSLRTSGTCDTFCKSYLLPNRTRSSKQKTHIFKKSLAPAWNFTFIYEDVTLHELSERALELTIWDHDRLVSNQFLGGARFSLGTGKHNGNKVTWMDSRNKELFLWKEMMSRPNFWVEGCVKLRPLLDTKREETKES